MSVGAWTIPWSARFKTSFKQSGFAYSMSCYWSARALTSVSSTHRKCALKHLYTALKVLVLIQLGILPSITAVYCDAFLVSVYHATLVPHDGACSQLLKWNPYRSRKCSTSPDESSVCQKCADDITSWWRESWLFFLLFNSLACVCVCACACLHRWCPLAPY